ncbi:MAG: ABC transporter ATP-binding protein [Deltaproteobacteria bacterium]|nr:ABC transporter ATP-binding protein [Deltaproteobacteria bacterium]
MDALVVKELRKVYGNRLTALDGISFTIQEGDFFALLGPNGAGKSTAIGIISSLVNKSSGHVRVFGADLDEDPGQVKKSIGLVPQEFNFSIFEKVYDIVIQQAGYYGISPSKASSNARELLVALGLWNKKDEIARNLSGGMKRRLMIARAMVHRPRLLILDEPTAGVDVEIRHSMWGFIREINRQGTTIILTTHYLEEVEELCRNVAIIDKGKILTNTSLKELLSTLDRQCFVLDLKQPPPPLPEDSMIRFHQADSLTLEAELPKDMTINMLFERLNQLGIQVCSMRSKSNRIESLFLSLIQEKQDESS